MIAIINRILIVDNDTSSVFQIGAVSSRDETIILHVLKKSGCYTEKLIMNGITRTTKFAFPVLVVEDNLLMRKILEASLMEAGYEVVSAGNGREALEIYGNGYYPIIMTDWVMPEMDGLELCRVIRESHSERYTYIILLTSQDSKTEMIQGLEAGADEYLVKPVNPAELTVRLKTARRILDLESSLKTSLEEIKNLSLKDSLTGIFNRRYLNERLPHEIKRAYRYERPMSLIMLDIDHFKAVNDTYGHQTGDIVLKGCADCITGSIRKEIDWPARFGGEEFVIVLPETDLPGAMVVAERLRQLVAGRATRTNGTVIRITASLGVASFDPEYQREPVTAEILAGHADKCLYQAKNGGRNRVIGIQL
ncbi:MAG: response receiver-modulated diguanylate [Geobacteraceae bacterium]|nr:MAG: response receiver-modulated diguanylate [Geobacteraceae bacterium]